MNKNLDKKRNVLIVGAGEAGKMTLEQVIKHNNKLNYSIKGFIDDDDKKQNKTIKRVKIIGKIKDIKKLIKKYKIDLILISIPSAKGQTIRNIISNCEKQKIEFKIVPGIFEIITGDVKIEHIRDVKPEDLLGRESVDMDISRLRDFFNNETVLVTGAAGSIGLKISERLTRFGFKKVIFLDQNESELFYLKHSLNNEKNNFKYYIANICDKIRMNYIFKKEKPTIIFHAAAYKHVPLMEDNIYEALNVNVLGTLNLLELSLKYKIKTFLLISTDKAVNPTSIMGATKRIAEKLILAFSKKISSRSNKKYLAVRFGNVLGSRGSVVPLLKKQIKNGGPITITHPKIYRYFMTISEAVTLVLHSSCYSKNGEIFVLDMGEQILIIDLAKDLITLSGLTPGKDIDINITGLRPGEKLYEELLTSEDKVNTTKHKKLYITKPEMINIKILNQTLDKIRKEMLKNEYNDITLRRLIKCIVPEFK